jgi:hypothetical protein
MNRGRTPGKKIWDCNRPPDLIFDRMKRKKKIMQITIPYCSMSVSFTYR